MGHVATVGLWCNMRGGWQQVQCEATCKLTTQQIATGMGGAWRVDELIGPAMVADTQNTVTLSKLFIHQEYVPTGDLEDKPQSMA